MATPIRISEDVMARAINVAERPTPEQIDELARQHQEAQLTRIRAIEAVFDIERKLIDLVTLYGLVPAHAEKSRRLKGVLAEVTVTKADTLAVNDDRVETLKDALEANNHAYLFPRLFTLRSKYEVVEGAESALKSVALPKRLAEKVLNLWGRCIDVKAKKPSLKVTIADPAKPAKKSRAKKEASK
jgi:hypothetical protein